ncbi:MAG TPA: hypothetical protein VHW65_11830 [Gemmatimonadales bacterium]|nr:hypothetical protein [Gemmatimonadales bacterium]
MPRHPKSRSPRHHHVEETRRPDTPELEGGTPLPEELTGRASRTDEGLAALFDDDGADHMADGFRGGSNGDRDTDIPRESDTDQRVDDDVTAD